MRTDHRNNFDLLRTLAALQVVYLHAVEHLHVTGPVTQRVNDVVALFPGVPIFFVISGFLIAQSYERSAGLGGYVRNRLLRIYPALWVCFAVSLVLLSGFGKLTWSFLTSPSFWLWTAGQLTAGQFFNPGALRTFGVGVVNGSLWTIPVELQFYVALPFLYWLCIRGRSRTAVAGTLGAVALLSFAVWCFWHLRLGGGDLRGKLLQVTVAPHLFLFLTGTLLYRNWDRLARLFEGRALLWLGIYLGERVAEHVLQGSAVSALLSPVIGTAVASAASLALLALVVVSVAHTRRDTSRQILRGHDLSYGIYIYHMLVVNVLIQLHFTESSLVLAIVFVATIAAAAASWICVERPALRLKQLHARPGALGRGLALTAPLAIHSRICESSGRLPETAAANT